MRNVFSGAREVSLARYLNRSVPSSDYTHAVNPKLHSGNNGHHSDMLYHDKRGRRYISRGMGNRGEYRII